MVYAKALKRARVVGRENERAACRRPLEPDELPRLEALGRRLRELRRWARLTQRELARAAELSERHVGRLEGGRRRTRRTTLERLCAALVSAFGLGFARRSTLTRIATSAEAIHNYSRSSSIAGSSWTARANRLTASS